MIDRTSAAQGHPQIRAELNALGLRWLRAIHWNEDAAALQERALCDEEVVETADGAVLATTGQHTGRSPKDKFIVLDENTAGTVWWANNAAMSPAHFERLKTDFMAHARLRSLHVQDLEACADPAHRVNIRVITELAWHSLFMRHLLKPVQADEFVSELTIIDLPSFKADPAIHGTRSETVIVLDITNKLVLIGGTAYAGEMKKAVFTYLNHVLPDAGVLPMHCSANVGKAGDTAIFFGLSGTGKTTLSTDPDRALIGDDEHGWGENGIFNFENGCYAKVINLSAENEPDIFRTTTLKGTVLENIVLDRTTNRPDFADGSLTENTRAAYPLSAIANVQASRVGPAPKTIIMLCADAFGVLPPIAKLNAAQAMDMYLAGYTAKLAGTERGVKQPEATFSACFGAPFLPRHPTHYAAMLGERMARGEVRCFLLNTGWTGGAYGEGTRMKLVTTRAMLKAALKGELDRVACRLDENFGFEVPISIPSVDEKLLNPRQTWATVDAYDQAATQLKAMFVNALAKLKPPQPAQLHAAE
ncbi:MAG: phosphoenolpyruvate carboxykinase (ATP) [Alphaproteobacteria bacterium]|nr:phosphoenolpyruvate carboxykinase (ATP) [Alphaproteobacteria bacterium]